MIENQINATRMDLTKLKNKLSTAAHGHKLLKDKLDEMIRQFLLITKAYKPLRISLEENLIHALAIYEQSQSAHSSIEVYEKMLVPSNEIKASYSKKTIIGIIVPQISFTPQTANLTFSLIDSDPNLDESILLLGKLLPKLLELAEADKACHLLAKEIEKIRRRVNAIEHFMIPELKAQINEITIKLADVERSNIIRTMKSKEIVLEKFKKDRLS